jgi:hypothetical protein
VDDIEASREGVLVVYAGLSFVATALQVCEALAIRTQFG